MNLKKESKAEIILYSWFLEHGIKPYLNRIDKKISQLFKYDIFKTDNPKKPDMIIYSPIMGYCAIEIKSDENSRDIRGSCKIIDYHNDYINNVINYFINNEKIDIKQFLIATNNSPKGKLFLQESIEDNMGLNKKSGSIYAAKNKIIPRYEYVRTSEFVRTLWASWKDRTDVGIGVVLSSCLDTKEENGFPKIFTQIKEEKLLRNGIIKPCWKQKWVNL